MPRACPVCVSHSRTAIERDILQLRSPTEVGRRWKLDRKTVRTHRDRDMDPMAIVDLNADVSTLTRVEDLTHRLESALAQTAAGTTYANLAGQLRQSLELVARLRRELDERPQIAILAAPEWLAVRELVLNALEPFPLARMAVASSLSSAVEGNPAALGPRRRSTLPNPQGTE